MGNPKIILGLLVTAFILGLIGLLTTVTEKASHSNSENELDALMSAFDTENGERPGSGSPIITANSGQQVLGGRPEEYKKKIDAILSDGESVEGSEDLEKSLQKNPLNPDGMQQLAKHYFEKGQGDKALKMADLCLELNRFNPECQTIALYATPKTEAKGKEGASGPNKEYKERLKNCLRSTPRNVDCLMEMSKLVMQEGDPQKAEGLVKFIGENYPGTREHKFIEGVLLKHLEETERSNEAINLACKSDHLKDAGPYTKAREEACKMVR